MSEVTWLLRRADAAEQAEMPEKAGHYRAAAAEIESLQSRLGDSERTRGMLESDLMEMRRRLDAVTKRAEAAESDWQGCLLRLETCNEALLGPNGALTRMDRARALLLESGNWGVLDTTDLRALLSAPSAPSEGEKP